MGALGGSILAIGAFAPTPASAFVKAKGYITADVTSAASASGDTINTGDRLRFDFTIEDKSVTTDNSSLNEWKYNNQSSPLISSFSISKCTVGSSDCSSYTSGVTTGSYNSLSRNLFSVTPQASTWPSNPSVPTIGLGVASDGYNTLDIGYMAKIGGMTVNLTSVYLGKSSLANTLNNLLASSYSWNQIGQGSPARSSLAAENIIQNVGSNTGFYALSATSPSGSIGYDNGMSESTGALLNVNGISFQKVPGPLPILGSISAFFYSRKLRKRISEVKSVY